MKHFGLGLLVGLILFIGPGLITGTGGLLGSNLLSGLLSFGILGVVLLGVIYDIIGGILYGLILRFKVLFQVTQKSMKFSGGILLAYLIFWIVGLFAFSNFGF